MMVIKKIFVSLITAARGASIIWLAHLLPTHYFFALVLVAGFAATDWIDGWLARRWNTTTKFGAFLDPLTDKIFYLGGLWLLTPLVAPLGEIFRQTLWPEFFLLVIRIPPFPRWLDIKTPATQYGKVKMICQSFTLIYILWGLFLHRPDIVTAGIYLAFACVLLSLLSLASHFLDKKNNKTA